MKQETQQPSALDYPGYCLAMSLLFTAALGLSIYLHAL